MSKEKDTLGSVVQEMQKALSCENGQFLIF